MNRIGRIAGLILLSLLVSLCAVTTSSASSLGTLIFGNSTYTRNQYSRVVKLSNGSLLATFNKISGTAYEGFPIYRSTNNGTQWNFVTTVTPSTYNIPTDSSACPMLFVLPTQMGSYAAGTILLAFTENGQGVNGRNTIHILRSTDNGTSWQYHSSQVPVQNAKNTWEPELYVSGDGKLVLAFADERQSGYSQVIAHMTSVDGGVTFSGYTIDVGIQNNSTRPGMPRVVKLKNGSYFMVYEIINAASNEGGLRYRTSSNGLNWGSATDMGTLIQNGNGEYPKACPELALLDDGTPNGRLFVRGMLDQVDNRDGILFSNSANGAGAWESTDAPLKLSGYTNGAAWSGTLLPLNSTSLLEINTIWNGSYMEVRSAVGSYSGGVNIALNKPASASSSWDGNYTAGKAVNGSIADPGWSPVGTSAIHWWQVDLGAAQRITRIEVVSRQSLDQPETRRNFEVWASNNADMSQGHVVLGSVGSGGIPYQGTWTLNVSNTTPYRYVALIKTANEYFFLAEVRVFGQ